MQKVLKAVRGLSLFFISLLAFLFGGMLFAQSQNAGYDSTLAKKLNADEYGMKKYVMVLLKSGSAKDADKKLKDSIFAGHMKNIIRLAAEGKLALAGPFITNDKYRGVYIFNVETIEEAKKLVDTDPVVIAKIFEAEIFIWYGSAALQEVNGIHNKIQKSGF